MKIGITCYPTYGGSGIVATELGKELAERGHEIHFISYAAPLRLKGVLPRIYFHEVEVTTYPLFDHPPYTLALATKMAEVAELQGLDLIHCHYAIPHSVSAFLAKSMLHPRSLPVVTTLHGTDITLVGADRSYLPITRFSIEKSDGVTAVSQSLKESDLSNLRSSERDRGHLQFRELRDLQTCGVDDASEFLCPAGRKSADSSVEFPRGEASGRCG